DRLVAMEGVPAQRMHVPAVQVPAVQVSETQVSEMHVASNRMMAARAPEMRAVHPHAGEASGAEAASTEAAPMGAATSAGHDIGQTEQQNPRGGRDDDEQLASDHARSRQGERIGASPAGKRFI